MHQGIALSSSQFRNDAPGTKDKSVSNLLVTPLLLLLLCPHSNSSSSAFAGIALPDNLLPPVVGLTVAYLLLG